MKYLNLDQEKRSPVKLPVFLKDKDGDVVKTVIGAHVVEAKVPFLLGMDALEEFEGVIDVAKRELKIGKTDKTFKLKETNGGHLVLNFESSQSKTFHVTQVDDTDQDLYKKVRNVHRLTGHKMEKNMIYM